MGQELRQWSGALESIPFAKAWCEEMELERESIRFGQNIVPGIPIPKVIHTWIDREWNRSFLIWHQLSTAQKMHIAYDIAQYCCKFASLISPTFESATNFSVLAPCLTTNAELSYPSWKPRLLGPLGLKIFRTHLSNLSTQSCPSIGTCLHFYGVERKAWSEFLEDMLTMDCYEVIQSILLGPRLVDIMIKYFRF